MQTDIDIKQYGKILVARNSPVAAVIGAGSFFGSHLALRLLDKNIQVIGVCNLDEKARQDLTEASSNKNFHLIDTTVNNLSLGLEKLDYIFIIPQKETDYRRVFDAFKKFKSRLLLISSIDLYDREIAESQLSWLKTIESGIAKIVSENQLNARILRLGPIFGPNMDFDDDPIAKLIAQSLNGDLQKELSLEFSSRALFIDDACDLAVKCIFAGSTAQKIFDGVSPHPIKVSDIKQILLDPVWYESRTFTQTELPPWPTPNLEKTIKFLNWHPKNNLVANLRKTLAYFKDHEIKIPKILPVKQTEWKGEKASELEGLKTPPKKEQVKKKSPKLWLFLGIIFIGYALLWPAIQVGWGIFSFKYQLSAAVKYLEQGQFDQSLASISQAKNGAEQIWFDNWSLGRLTSLTADAAQNTILGIQALYQGLKSVTGERLDSPKASFEQAQTFLASADEQAAVAKAILASEDFQNNLPGFFKDRVISLTDRLSLYANLIQKGRSLSRILPQAVAIGGSKSYLVLLQNNNELRPTGGFIGSIAKISFEDGKLKKLEVNDTYAVDGQLKIHVEPPKEIRTDLDQKDYFLRDSNWEPDFPTAARQAEWFYTRETGARVDGVVALDISAVEDLLQTVGPLDLADFNEKIDSGNLFAKAISHAEVNFFPGSQAKKSFLTALTAALFNKLFFLPNQNWPAVVTSLGHSLEKKHMSVYLNEPKLFTFVVSQNWASIFPRESAGKKRLADFLSVVEANLGANKANYYLDRSYKLETTIGKDGEVSHLLRIAYTNRSPSEAFPAGKYKNRLRIYLPFGTKLTKALWTEKEITKDISSFVDYGRSGYSMLLELLPKEQKTLILDYQTPMKLDFQNNRASYKLDVIKQAGTLKDPFEWRVTYPINMRLASEQTQKLGPQEQVIKTDLSSDKTFRLEFIK